MMVKPFPFGNPDTWKAINPCSFVKFVKVKCFRPFKKEPEFSRGQMVRENTCFGIVHKVSFFSGVLKYARRVF